jgi:hypothetical protein
MTILETVDDYRKFGWEQIKNSGYPWYYITVELKNVGTRDYFAAGIIVEEEIKKPWYMYKYRYLNKTRLRKFIPVKIRENQEVEIFNSVVSSNRIELEVKIKNLWNVYLYYIFYSGIDPELLIKRVTNYVDPII